MSPIVTLPGAWRAVVLDLDGLLVDTEPLWLEAKKAVFAGHGAVFGPAEQSASLGADDVTTAILFAHRLGLPDGHVEAIRTEYLDRARQAFMAGVTARPGARELVAALSGRVPLGLASNTQRSLVDLILDRSGLAGSFDAISTGDEVTPKPAPDVYLLACRRLGVDPASAVALEDSPAGVRAAKAAGMRCIAVPSGHGADLSHADLVIGSLLEIVIGYGRPTLEVESSETAA